VQKVATVAFGLALYAYAFRQVQGTKTYEVRVRAVADNGAADKAALKLLAHEFGIARSGLDMIGEEDSADQTLIAPDSEALRAQLEALL
ncbi:MAG: hypothetical protein AAF940_06380, partial [Pseudomonadota bacterium]